MMWLILESYSSRSTKMEFSMITGQGSVLSDPTLSFCENWRTISLAKLLLSALSRFPAIWRIGRLFAEVPNLWDYKDSAQDIIHQQTMLRLIDKDRRFELMAGSDAQILTTSLLRGAPMCGRCVYV